MVMRMKENIYIEGPERKVSVIFGNNSVEFGVESLQSPRYGDDTCWEGVQANFPLEKYNAGLEELLKNGECKIESEKKSLVLKKKDDKVNFIEVSSGPGRYCSAELYCGLELDIRKL